MSVKIDIWLYASIRSNELDDMLSRPYYVCGACGYPKNHKKNRHGTYCVVGRLLEIRMKMVPMIIKA